MKKQHIQILLAITLIVYSCNKTKKTDLPVITIKQGRKNTYCNEVEILGPSKILYCGSGDEKPLLSCGARVVIETEGEIKIIS